MSDSHNLIELISESDISARIKEIGLDISSFYKNESVIVIIVLNGAVIFASDLIRALSIDCKLDSVKVSSYSGISSSGKIEFEKDLALDINGKNILIVEDIIDTGNTISFLKEHIKMKNPKSIKITSLLMKPQSLNLPFDIDWVGFEISPEFVVGYGLDYNQELRNLNAIYKLGDVI
ncbi:MAG: hypoxanthine phosphoribosyltransferase [Candidatus Neomarinimicrobiota bacterium]|nr:MAG: hypoxanthine phosphoribosyltransferase [Candidatus Marinimicrobia bacterium TMED108]RCL90687.1 MAG: hypoxanthine phosphoribosyltransferase [bacterium]|tara:strand:- start:3571 stop:4101 length:531 start_codon:yes stop_codon:yes gene_type:complete